MINRMDLITGLSMTGAVVVALGHTFPANVVWAIANPLLVIHNLRIQEVKQARLFAFFGVCAFAGIFKDIIGM